MIKVENIETIRRAYFIEGLSIREIARKLHHGRRLVKKAIADAGPYQYQLQKPRPAPVLGPYQDRINALLIESEQQPRKQRYTARLIYRLIRVEGYQGSESTVRHYVGPIRKAMRRPDAYLPLEFDPGQDAQMDWGEATVEIAGERQIVQFFVMRLNHSRVRFVMAFPFQKQEAFFEGHIQAFHFFGGVPRRITYDNLKTAVYRVLIGRNRQEQDAFVAFRSYYLFESNYCTPGQGHEKGGVESDVGYIRRNFLTPVPKVGSFAELNAYLQQECRQDTNRRMRGQEQTIAELWEFEKAQLLPLPATDYPACISRPVKANPYSQVVFETNRYSVPAEYVGRQLVLRAYPFRVEILSLDKVIAKHERCFEREKDILDPLHYLGLLSQRPGAFEHAIPVRRWRKVWPAVYETLLETLQERWPDGRGLREFIAILKLHREHPAQEVEQAIRACLKYGTPHLDSIRLRLRCERDPELVVSPLDLAGRHQLQGIGEQPVRLGQYDRLLRVR
ncbi:MAG: IS21 family transposase [Xanthomonadales bacterium]|nr:IS21 family transposase [Xanthomonadales bacterium]